MIVNICKTFLHRLHIISLFHMSKNRYIIKVSDIAIIYCASSIIVVYIMAAPKIIYAVKVNAAKFRCSNHSIQ